MCKHEVQAAYPSYTSHDVDEQRLLPGRGHGLVAELLPEGHVRRQGPEYTSGESRRLSLSSRDLRRN